MRKIITLGIMLLFLGMTISSSTGLYLEKQSTIATFDGNTLYVGGSGPNNYTRIQDAIDDASDGDAVFVYNGTYYAPKYERINVDNSISLMGEDRNTTVIDGGEYNFATISILTNHVNIKGFTILGSIKIEANYTSISGNIISITRWECVRILSLLNATYHDNIITNNLMLSNASGIVIYNSHNNIISNNKIDSGGPGYSGILLSSSSDNSIISGNIIRNNGIFIRNCNNSVIIENRISTSRYGIYLDSTKKRDSCFNMITRNIICSNDVGICLYEVRANIIFENNFLNNSRDVKLLASQNHFIKNYWNRPRILPKLIFGVIEIGSIWLPWINIDWRPALRPYDIGV